MDFPSFRERYNTLDSIRERTDLLLAFAEEAMQSYPEDLVPLLEESRQRCLEAGIPLEAAFCDRLLGWMAFDQADFAAAQAHFERSEEIFRRYTYEPGRLKALNGIASVQLRQGHYEAGLSVFREALALAEDLGDRSQVVVLKANIGETLIDLRQFAEAEEYLRAAVESEPLSPLNESLVLNQWAKACRGLGREDEARRALTRSINLARQGQFLSSLSVALGLLGSLETMTNPGTQAQSLLEEAKTLARQAGDRVMEVRATIDLGQLSLVQNNLGSAVIFFRDALELARSIGAQLLEAEALKGQSEVSKSLGLWQAAFQAFEQYHQISDHIHAEAITRQLAQIKTDQSRRETEILKEQSRVLALLGDIGQTITASLDLETIILRVYQSMGGLMKADVFGLGIYHEDRDIIDYRLLMENGRQNPPFEVSANAQTFSGWCVRHRQDILINDIEIDYGSYFEAPPTRFLNNSDQRSRSLIYMPLLAERKVLGVLSVQSYTSYAYTESDRATLRTLAASIAIAVQNARLFEQVHRLATIDSLTGAATRRHLFERTEEEFHRFRRHEIPLALVMIDLDNFKILNDSWGHAAGDKVLAEFGALCLAHKRPHDLFGRYGGEEFSLVLSGTSLEGAQKSAERLCQRVRDFDWRTPDGQPLVVTASFGVTEFSPLDEEVTRVFGRADGALYEAKQAGRNRVVVRTS